MLSRIPKWSLEIRPSFIAALRSLQQYSQQPKEEYSTRKTKDSVKVVVCGARLMGLSVAYHLGKLGLAKDIVILSDSKSLEDDFRDKKHNHCSGLIERIKPSATQIKLVNSTMEMYRELEKNEKMTQRESFLTKSGSLNLARNRDRMTSFRRIKAQS